MANIKADNTVNVYKTFENMGDGTYAEVISVGNASGVGTLSPFLMSNDMVTVIEPDATQPASASVTSAAVIQIGGNPYVDTAGYSSISVLFTSVGTSNSAAFEISDDGTNWVTTSLTNANVNFSASGSNLRFGSGNALGASAVAYHGGLYSRYFRIRVSTYSSGTVTAAVTLRKTPWSPGQWPAQGPTSVASSISSTVAPVVIGVPARTANSNVTNGQVQTLQGTLTGALIQKPFSIPEADWSYAAASGGISNTTTAVTIAAAAGSGLRNYVTALQLSSDALTTATEVAIRDGAAGTVIWRSKITTAGWINGRSIEFPSPLKSTANTLLEVVTLTASGAGAVFVNVQGYIAP